MLSFVLLQFELMYLNRALIFICVLLLGVFLILILLLLLIIVYSFLRTVVGDFWFWHH